VAAVNRFATSVAGATLILIGYRVLRRVDRSG
jgi:hypothetical protein